jgi:polyphosphate kinase
MERNLDWRVEAAFPIYDPGLQQQVLEMMAWQAADNCKARILDQMQTNRYVDEGAGPRRAQYDTYAFLERLGNRSVSEEPAATSPV